MHKLLKILITLPVTSCEAERSFNVLKRVKDYRRATMADERLNGLALLYIYPELSSGAALDTLCSTVTNKFMANGKRRLR